MFKFVHLFKHNFLGVGFNEVTFTTKPSVMEIGYRLYKRMGFEEVSEKDGIVSMRMELEK